MLSRVDSETHRDRETYLYYELYRENYLKLPTSRDAYFEYQSQNSVSLLRPFVGFLSTSLQTNTEIVP
jgi:hypothetical protein